MPKPYYGRPVGLPIEEVGFGFNKDVITGLLRQRYGFDGVVCTDWRLLNPVVVDGEVLINVQIRPRLSTPQVSAEKCDAFALGLAAPDDCQARRQVALKLASLEIGKPALCPRLALIAFSRALYERDENGPARPQYRFQAFQRARQSGFRDVEQRRVGPNRIQGTLPERQRFQVQPDDTL